MSDGSKYNSKTAEWLDSQECAVTPENALGLEEEQEKPDFLCEKNNCSFWVEVKSIDLPGWHKDHGQYYDEFKSREKNVKTPGRAFVKVMDKISSKDIQVALSMVERVLSGQDHASTNKKQLYVVIPKDPVPKYNEFIEIEYHTNAGEEVLYSVKSQSGKYSRNHLGGELKLDAKVKFKDNNNALSEGDLFSLGLSLGLFEDTNFHISIKLVEGTETFRICSLGPSIANESSNLKIIRNSSSKARSQFKSANEKLGEKPGIVVFHHDNLFASNDNTFISAFYGDWTYQWPTDGGTDGSLIYGRNGFWNSTQNTTVSAAVYFTKEIPIIIYNRWAAHPLPLDLFDCKAYIPEENGSFTIRD